MKKVIILLVTLVLLFVLFVLFRTPSLEREWKEDLAHTTKIEFLDDRGTVHIGSIRDWMYNAEGPVSKGFVEETYTLDSLTGMQLVVEPFPGMEVFGHTLLTFEFRDAPPIVLSVEARLEEDEMYKGLAGLFNEYELIYTWGTERDFLTRRAVMLGHELLRYQLEVSAEQTKEIFLAFLDKTIAYNTQPAFYNTIAHNCTNELMHVINEKEPGTFSWDWSRILTGNAAHYLNRIGYIEGESIEELDSDITEKVRSLVNDPDFSEKLRR